MPDESDPYELDDNPFDDEMDSDEPLESSPYPEENLDQLAAADDAHPRPTWGPKPPLLDASGRLDEDIHCRSCGYNLRGQSPTGSCPECGFGVEHSLESNNLRFANPDWLRAMHTGASFLAIGSLCLIPLSCLVGGIASAFTAGVSQPSPGTGFSSPSTTNTSAIMAEAVTNLILSLASAVVFGYGMWKLSQPEPGVEGTNTDSTARILARWLVLPIYAVSCVLAPFYFIPADAVQLTLTIVDAILGIAGAVGAFALLWYLRQVAIRIPDESLASQTRIVFWGFLAVMLLAVPALIIMAISVFSMIGSTSGSSAAAGAGIAVVLSCGLGIGVLVFGIWWLVLMFRYRSAFGYALGRSGG